MVPEAEFSSYYGRPIVTPATWKNPEVPLYLFLGGLGGTSALIGAMGEFSGPTVVTAGLHALPWLRAVRVLTPARWIPGLRKGAAVGAAVFGGPMTTYTAVLLANTATPSGHEPHEELPFLCAGSALAADGGVTMALTPVAEAGPSRKVAVVGALVELAAAHKVENGHGIVSEPFHIGRGRTDFQHQKPVRISLSRQA